MDGRAGSEVDVTFLEEGGRRRLSSGFDIYRGMNANINDRKDNISAALRNPLEKSFGDGNMCK